MSKIAISNLEGLYDKKLKDKLELSLKNNDKIDVILRNKTVFISINNEFKFKGEFYKECEKLALLKDNLQKITFWQNNNPINDLFLNFKEESNSLIYIGHVSNIKNKKKLQDWVKKSHDRDKLKDNIKNQVLILSKQRCQLCGKNLDSHIISKKIGKGLADYAQIAHIEGAGFDGPRSNINKEDCDSVDNLMLLCYECHREIDFIDPDNFSVEYLKSVKKEQEDKVLTLLNSLEYPTVFPLKFFCALSPSDKTTINTREIATALQNCGFSIPQEFWKQDLFEVPKSTDHPSAVHEVFYWNNLFKIIKKDIGIINHYFECAKNHHNSKGVAFFCHHGISESILLGRILGDSATVHLFQKHRIENLESYWTWPNNNDKSGHKDIEFFTKIIQEPSTPNEKEALLLIEISGSIKEENIPLNLYNEKIKKYNIPTLKIETNKDHKKATAISSLEALSKLRSEIYGAVNILQEKWKCTKIHVINICPSTANIVIGQSLQDRHHAEIICYEINKDSHKQTPTIGITNKLVYFYYKPEIFLSFKD